MIHWFKNWQEKRRLQAEARRNPLAELARVGKELDLRMAQVQAQFHSAQVELPPLPVLPEPVKPFDPFEL